MPDRRRFTQVLVVGAVVCGSLSAQTSSTISIGDVTQQFETGSGSGLIDFTVRISSPVGQNVTVIASTADVTARGGLACGPGVDYLRLQQVGLTIVANQPTATLSVPFCGDTVDEEVETFRLQLSIGYAPSGVTLGDSQGVGTILDDDNPPPVRVTGAQTAEGNAGTSNLAYTLTRDGLSDGRTGRDVHGSALEPRERHAGDAIERGDHHPQRRLSMAMAGQRQPGRAGRRLVDTILGAAAQDAP